MRAFSKKRVNEDRVNHFLERVIGHLEARGTLKPTLIKYRYLGLKAAVKCLLGSDFIEALDYQTCFETLRDHNTVQSWLDSLRLEAEGRIPKGYSLEDLRAAKLTEVKEDADRLDHVAIDKKEYDRLLSTEKKYWQNVRARDGWAADLI